MNEYAEGVQGRFVMHVTLGFAGGSMRVFRAVVTAGILLATACGGEDGGGSSAAPAAAPAPTPSPSAPTPTPTPTAQGSFPLTSALTFNTLYARLTYSGSPGQSALSDLDSMGAYSDVTITPSQDAVNGVHRIEENLRTRGAFATSLRQNEDAIYMQVDTFGRAGEVASLRLLSNSTKPANAWVTPSLRYTSFAGWTRQAQSGPQTLATWHVFGFQTPGNITPSGVRRFAMMAGGDYIVTSDDGKGWPYAVEADGVVTVDFDSRSVDFDRLELIFKDRLVPGNPGFRVFVTGTGTLASDGSLSGAFSTVPPTGMSGMPAQSFAAVRFAGYFFGPNAEEVGMALTLVGPEHADRPVRRGYGAAVLVGRPFVER
jgi:hypothetical protein